MTKRKQPKPAAKPQLRVEADRFNPGEWVVKNERGEAVASGFDTKEEADEWISTKQSS